MLVAGSVGDDFFGGYHDSAGVVMVVASEEVHAIVHCNHQPTDLGELLPDGSHLLFQALNPGDHTFQLANIMGLPQQNADERNQH